MNARYLPLVTFILTVAAFADDARLPDRLIVSIGDSYASGEGNPPFADKQCRRSTAAGPYQAYVAIDEVDALDLVEFISLACSGAKVIDPDLSDTDAKGGLLDPYKGADSSAGGILLPQIDQLVLQMCPGATPCPPSSQRRIDALLISIGGNDAGFAGIVEHCKTDDCTDASYQALVAAKISRLADDVVDAGGSVVEQSIFGRLADAIREKLNVGQVYITEYPDPTRKGDCDYCDELLDDAWEGLFWLSIDRAEVEWASNVVVPALNDAIRRAATRHGWFLVDRLEPRYRCYRGGGHGYCTSDANRWIVTWDESEDQQDNIDGTLHPNSSGHEIYRNRLFIALVGAFVDDSYTGSVESGTHQEPYKALADAVDEVFPGGTIWLRPGVYPGAGIYNKPMIWRATGTGVVVSNAKAPGGSITRANTVPSPEPTPAAEQNVDTPAALFAKLLDDTFVAERNPAANFAGAPILLVGDSQSGMTGSGAHRALFHFDIPSLPSQVELTSALLVLRHSSSLGSSATRLRACAVASPWSHHTVTWSDQPATSPICSTPGEHDESDVNDDRPIRVIDVTAIVMQWLNGTLPNHGLSLSASPAGRSMLFQSGENRRQPELVLLYHGHAPRRRAIRQPGTPHVRPALDLPADNTIKRSQAAPHIWDFTWFAPPTPCFSAIVIQGPGGVRIEQSQIRNASRAYPYRFRYEYPGALTNDTHGPWYWTVTVTCPDSVTKSESRVFWVEP